jgi:hypothetical protein
MRRDRYSTRLGDYRWRRIGLDRDRHGDGVLDALQNVDAALPGSINSFGEAHGGRVDDPSAAHRLLDGLHRGSGEADATSGLRSRSSPCGCWRQRDPRMISSNYSGRYDCAHMWRHVPGHTVWS